jgi:hypothetical protein
MRRQAIPDVLCTLLCAPGATAALRGYRPDFELDLGGWGGGSSYARIPFGGADGAGAGYLEVASTAPAFPGTSNASPGRRPDAGLFRVCQAPLHVFRRLLAGINANGSYEAVDKAWFYASSTPANSPISTKSANDGNRHQIVGAYPGAFLT